MDQDLLSLFTNLINNDIEKEIFKVSFSIFDEDELIEKLLEIVETNDDQD